MSENRTERPETGQTPRDERPPWNIVLLGASFATGNLGVSALAESTIKILRHRWPEAQITLFGSGYEPAQLDLPVGDQEVRIHSVPVRFCRRLALPYHFLWFAVYGVLAKLLPWAGARKRLFARNEYCRKLHEAHLAVDISAGDSFSDLYGIRGFFRDFLRKGLVLLYGIDLVLLPQTYGPFHRRLSRCLARYILKRAKKIYTRDKAGLEYLDGLLGRAQMDGAVRFAPDVAFVLDARKPAALDRDGLTDLRAGGGMLIGLNISGLLYYGGYTGHNEFGLKADYRQLTDRIVDLVLQKADTRLVLVPHVIPPGRYKGNVENDLSASLDVYERLGRRYPGRLFVARGPYDQAETKYIIGRCDFFIGTRMHTCIAALSQGIPAVGLSYSKKFRGVFESVGVGDLALEMRYADIDELVGAVDRAFRARETTAEHLRVAIPPVRQQVLSFLGDANL
jgi:colanic acid/amylovoran biosynthesis protein